MRHLGTVCDSARPSKERTPCVRLPTDAALIARVQDDVRAVTVADRAAAQVDWLQLAQKCVEKRGLSSPDFAQDSNQLALVDGNGQRGDTRSPIEAPRETALQHQVCLSRSHVVWTQLYPIWYSLRDHQWRLGLSEVVLDSMNCRCKANHSTQGVGEELTGCPQPSEDHHTGEDRHRVLVPVNGRIAPETGPDQQSWETEKSPICDAQGPVVFCQAAQFLVSQIADSLLHSFLPSIAFHDSDSKEDLPECHNPLVHLVLEFPHDSADGNTPRSGEGHTRQGAEHHNKDGQLEPCPEHRQENTQAEETVDATTEGLEKSRQLHGDIIIHQGHEIFAAVLLRILCTRRYSAARTLHTGATPAILGSGGQSLSLPVQGRPDSTHQLLVDLIGEFAAE
mmetsp:Transcript_94418/g.206663  ORF Transcript_94418/g.206663 Transcript_94418/m.206663 type:complete len:394 (-) Transcript_94418:390-1571(-)